MNLNLFKKKEQTKQKTKEDIKEEKKELEKTLQKMREDHKEYLKTRETEKREEEIKGIPPDKDDIGRVEEIPENLNTKEPWYIKTINTFFMILSIGFVSWLFILLPKMQDKLPDQKGLVTWFVLTVATLIVLSTITFITGVGQELWRRFFNRWRYKSGKYVNDVFITKSGVIKEIFVKKEDSGAFKVFNMPYVTNAKLSFFYKGLTTYMHREGNPDPINIWEERLTEHLSCGEMDVVMNSAQAFDVRAWLENLKMWVLILLGICVLAAAGAAYFAQNNNDMLKKGTYHPTIDDCRVLIPVPATPNQTPTQVYNPTTNSTSQINSGMPFVTTTGGG